MMILNLLDDLLLPFLQLANEERKEAEEVTSIGLLITLYMTGTYLPLPVLSWLRHATVKGLLRSWPSNNYLAFMDSEFWRSSLYPLVDRHRHTNPRLAPASRNFGGNGQPICSVMHIAYLFGWLFSANGIQ